MNDIQSRTWRHVMLALAQVESVPDCVLDRVGRVVRGLNAELVLFYSLYDPQLAGHMRSGVTGDARIANRIAESRRHLERVADALRDQGLEVRSSVRFDYPIFEAIVREVLRRGPNLLIVPAARMSPSAPQGLSHNDARLLEACPCPVLLLKTEKVYSNGPIVAAVDPKHAREKPSELDDMIVAAAKTLSRALSDAFVHVYHAVAPVHQGAGSLTAETGEVRDALQRKEHFEECESEVRAIAARYEIPDALVRVEGGPVESALPLYARAVRADAVVIGAVSRSYPERALYGYRAERVLDALGCDLLIIKPRGFRCPVSRRPHRAGRRQATAEPAHATHES